MQLVNPCHARPGLARWKGGRAPVTPSPSRNRPSAIGGANANANRPQIRPKLNTIRRAADGRVRKRCHSCAHPCCAARGVRLPFPRVLGRPLALAASLSSRPPRARLRGAQAALPQSPIQRELSVQCWDDLHRIAASLKDGLVTSVLLTEKLQALDARNRVRRGMAEYRCLLRTIDILTFMSESAYRRRVGRMLNIGETIHKLARDVAYDQQGVLSAHDFACQHNRATCLSLPINVIAVWNTRYLQAAWDYLRTEEYPLQNDDLTHLSPILSGHIHLHGSHHFDCQAPKTRQGQVRPLRVASVASMASMV